MYVMVFFFLVDKHSAALQLIFHLTFWSAFCNALHLHAALLQVVVRLDEGQLPAAVDKSCNGEIVCMSQCGLMERIYTKLF